MFRLTRFQLSLPTHRCSTAAEKGFAVESKLLDHGAMGTEDLQRAGTLLKGVNLAVNVKNVLPRLALDRPRLDLGEVSADSGELVECGNERSRSILYREGNADLVRFRIGSGVLCAPHKKEAGEVLRVVFNAGLKNLGSVVIGRGLAGNGPRVPVAQLDQLLHAAGGVVEGVWLHPGVLGQKFSALRQSHRMREDAVDLADRGPGDGDEIVVDAQQCLPLHAYVVGQQQIEVLKDRTSQAVFDG